MATEETIMEANVAYKAFCDNRTNILKAALDPHALANKLFCHQIIGSDDLKRITDQYSGQTADERMGHLLDILEATIKKDGHVFGQFIKILSEDECSQREKTLAEEVMATYEGNDQ